MRKRKFLFIWPVLFVFIWSGCAGQNPRINSRQMEMDNLKRQIQFLQEQNSQLSRELQNMKKQLEETAVSTQQVKADFATKIDELLEQMEIVQSSLKDTNARMSNVRNSTASLASSQPETTTTPAERSFTIDRERELYNTAKKDLTRGNYQLALQGFLQFVSEYPNTDLTDNAQYWIGEVYYAQGRFQDAIQEFEKVIKRYQGADKTPSALLKIGFCYFNLEEVEQAKMYLEEVVTKHPDSDEARLARGRLATLN